MNKIKALAAYLPQFHPIPENDEWWGKGFTEWTNVSKAKPLFKGHWQPRLPADLGIYDLRVSESREAQADLAKRFGIYGFCYWHYWFGGKRLIERPYLEVVKSGKPDFPFCIAWANQTWSGTWHGLSNDKILIEQTYPGKEDYIAHFYSLLESFCDKRYIEVNGKKLVFIFKPSDLPDAKAFTSCWQELAIKEGLNGIHFVGLHMPYNWNAKAWGFEGMTNEYFNQSNYRLKPPLEKVKENLFFFKNSIGSALKRSYPNIISYDKYVNAYPEKPLSENQYPWILADWDNTPRSGKDGWLFQGASPEKFGELCKKAFEETNNKPEDEKIVFIKSWNEWAEGNYLEPDQVNGLKYLEEFKKVLDNFQ